VRERVAHRREHLEHDGESTDLEDLAHDGLEPGDDERAALRLGLLSREHQHAEPRAADVVHAREIEHELILGGGAAQHVRSERLAQALGVGVVEAAGGGEDQRVGKASWLEIHALPLPCCGVPHPRSSPLILTPSASSHGRRGVLRL
jgi:hypothetical protein